METIKLKPSQINQENRWRTELGDIKSLAKSLKKYGNILPVVITRDHVLIDGGRRCAAAEIAEIELLCVYNDTVDPLELKELEFEANCHRLDFSPAERAKAVKEMQDFYQEKYGKSTHGVSGGWSADDTAKKLGVSRSYVTQQLDIAKAVEEFPELSGLKNQSDIRKAVKTLSKLGNVVAGLNHHEELLKERKTPFELHNCDAIDFMETIPDSSIDILLTDPLYGIEHDKLMIGTGGKTGGKSSTGYKFSDSTEPALRGYEFLARESYRFCNTSAQAYIFCAYEHSFSIGEFFRRAGWNVYVKPIIWIKRTTGSCNSPSHCPSDCYEVILFARKDNARIVKEGMPNWVECPPVLPSERLHLYEKPLKLLDNLLQRSCLPGQTLIDPFMGSGSAIHAGVERKLYCIGCDNSTEAYANAVTRMSKWMEEKGNQ
jgi:site-specific DNA-methyltransferase (adenine-specific)